MIIPMTYDGIINQSDSMLLRNLNTPTEMPLQQITNLINEPNKPVLQPQLLHSKPSQQESGGEEVQLNKYVKRSWSIIRIYALAHGVIYLILALITVVLEIALTVIPSNVNRGSSYNLYAGFWVGGVNFLAGIGTLMCASFSNYILLLSLAGLYFTAVFLTIFGLIIISLVAIYSLTTCGTSCWITGAQEIYWTLFSLGIVIGLMGGVFYTVLMLVIANANIKEQQRRIRKKNYGDEFFQNPYNFLSFFFKRS